MSLVTRCPNCETTFKVVRDQLRISEGWVRCGRCSEVFDATQDLQEVAPGEAMAAAPVGAAAAPDLADREPTAAQAGAAPSAPVAGAGRSTVAEASPSVAASPFDGWQSALSALGAATPRPETAGSGPTVAPPELTPSPTDEDEAGRSVQAEGAVATMAPAAPAWPAADMLELPRAAPTVAGTPEVPVPALGARVSAGDAQDADRPARSEPAWRRIQVPSLSQVHGVVADEPWPMRQASAADPAVQSPQGEKSPIDAAVDAQVQKALRAERARACADRVEAGAREDRAAEEGGQLSHGRAAEREETERDDVAPTSVLRQASTDEWPLPASVGAQVLPELRAEPLTEPEAPARTSAGVRSSVGPVLLGLLVLLGIVLLPLQMLRHERDAWSASQPALRPLIEVLCRHTGCAVQAPRRIDAVRIDGSSFTPSREGERYELGFTLRNAGAVAVAMPSIELSLLDGNERPVVRRVFHPGDFGAPAQMPARGEQLAQMQLSLQLPADQRAPAVVGYSLLAFYP